MTNAGNLEEITSNFYFLRPKNKIITRSVKLESVMLSGCLQIGSR